MDVSDFSYDLPHDRIASHPLEKRDQSKLLVFKKGNIQHENFSSIATHLPLNSLLFFNNTRVIPARLLFTKETGASIEIFLLNPLSPSSRLQEVMEMKGDCTWKCTIGNLKRWTENTLLSFVSNDFTLHAKLKDRTEGIVEFTWSGDLTFAEVVSQVGKTPLPPYIRRDANENDRERYQTIYSQYDGAVAAPTAGLHFTEQIFKSLEEKNIQKDFLTLHVSAGTFQPIKTKQAEEHKMHQEQIIISRSNITNLLNQHHFVIPVGTTAMRTLESLYWFGAKILRNSNSEFFIAQEDPYTWQGNPPSTHESLLAIDDYMERNGLEYLTGETSIYIRPGYQFKICKGLITNFHQPGSTLILLVAAFVGEAWRVMYNEALQNNYRFLSYGDSSLLLP